MATATYVFFHHPTKEEIRREIERDENLSPYTKMQGFSYTVEKESPSTSSYNEWAIGYYCDRDDRGGE